MKTQTNAMQNTIRQVVSLPLLVDKQARNTEQNLSMYVCGACQNHGQGQGILNSKTLMDKGSSNYMPFR